MPHGGLPQQGRRLDRSADLQPGKYTATARLAYGTGTLKSFEMGGHF